MSYCKEHLYGALEYIIGFSSKNVRIQQPVNGLELSRAHSPTCEVT